MPTLSNYPAGATNDPDAPFNQPMIDFESCEFEHAGEPCDEDVALHCECGTPICKHAVVVYRFLWKGTLRTARICEDCWLWKPMPKGEEVDALLNRALDHIAHGLTNEVYLDTREVVRNCLGQIAGERARRRMETEALLLRSVA